MAQRKDWPLTKWSPMPDATLYPHYDIGTDSYFLFHENGRCVQLPPEFTSRMNGLIADRKDAELPEFERCERWHVET